MGLVETTIVYGALGLVVSGAMALREERPAGAKLLGQVALSFVFWPLFAASVLARARDPERAETTAGPLASRIRAAEERLVSAIARVEGGVAAQALAPEVARIRSLGGSLTAMARRLAEIDELLGAPEFDEPAARAAQRDLAARARGEDDPRLVSLNARLANIERLRAMRARTSDDLERALLAMEEIASQMLLLKFAGKPDAEVIRLVKDVADSVQAITEALSEE